ncbi:MAG TPA: hypothetical protein VHE33_19960 [Acidobacteriaceae bacterium]|nr:hypothetical protein [Acidobacteriaceae bacterium]
MNEISKLLQERFGLSPDQAQEAERLILGLIRSKIPAQFQGIADSLLGSSPAPGAEPSQAAAGSGNSLLSAAEGLLHRG